MASETAKRAAGTYIADSFPNLPNVQAWLTQECRNGLLAPAVKTFCETQAELLDASLVLVESVSSDCIQCRIPCRHFDGEASSPFDTEVCFNLDPRKGTCLRTN